MIFLTTRVCLHKVPSLASHQYRHTRKVIRFINYTYPGSTELTHRLLGGMAAPKESVANGAGESDKGLPFRPRNSSLKGGTLESPKGDSSIASSGNPKAAKSQKIESKEVKTGKQSNQEDKSGSKMQSSNSNADRPLPDFIIKRNKLFDELKRKRDAEILEKDHPIINVVLDLGLDKEGKPRPAMPVAAKAWESTPGSFLRHVDKDISSDVVIAKVDGKELWDLDRPLEYDCRVSYLPFTSAEGRNVFWHSSAHVLGEAAECQYQCLLSHGPPVEQGFFYDMAIKDG